MTEKNYPEIIARTSSYLAQLRKSIPETTRGFGQLAQAATKDGVLDAKTKEMIAMALAVATRCDPCVGFHAQALVKLGGTREELNEVLGMCIYMGGGPALMYAAEALAAFDAFAQLAQATDASSAA